MIRVLFIFCIFILVSCGKAPEEMPLTLKQGSYSDLPGWGSDDMAGLREAFSRSCTRILKRAPDAAMGALAQSGNAGDWQGPCREFLALGNVSAADLRVFFEARFTPHSVRAGNDPKGLFTGYYEASLHGSLVKSGPYQIPLHARPSDLVMVNLGEFRDELKGQRIAGRVRDGNLKPYETREEIVNGKWPHNDKVLVWVDDPVDAFFVQVQGSGLVELPDGKIMRIGYAGQNGHIYYAIGRELIKRGELGKDEVSLQTIRRWLEANPAQAGELMNTNRSYVFFRELDGSKETGGPIGGEGIALTAGRSLAVDRSLLSYGMPLWVDLDPPLEGEQPLRRLMIAQDTGGAITGPVRGDVFWGYGERAEHLAGHMKSDGRYWVLLPK